MKRYIIGLMAAGLFLQSCAGKLEVKPYDSLVDGEALGTFDQVSVALNGVYDGLQSTSYYGRNYWVMTEVNGDNVYIARSNSNRFLSSFRHDYTTQDADVESLWKAVYQGILRADRVITAVDAVKGDQAAKDLVKGQALVLRAMMHFDLVKVYARPYAQGNGSQLGVPIKLKFEDTYPQRNTVKEVYDQVILDLTTGRDLLKNADPSDKYHVNANTATALLARVYLQKGDNANAAIESAKLIGGGDYSLLPSSANFYNVPGSDEEIFTLRFVDNESAGSDNIGQMYLKPGYGDVRVSPDLYSTFDAADSRLVYLGKMATETVNQKYTGQGGVAGATSPKLVRLAEMYLIHAEAVSTTDPATALNDLNEIRTNRGLQPLVTVAPAAMLDSVLAESRREFMFEGHRYFDLLRNGKGVTRNMCGSSLEITAPCTIAPDAYNLIYPIPQAEKNVNPGITQNTGYGQ
ncbi:SusD-like starch-binding protein associating with outer membrane [Chitinophaga dinghuensis]|uniref:SusD-like starch-binding protein associating with outer membrane n=1 Tax=Chitinophaga dinghuensis TaxID=1539050 RepID=A0A327VLV2_9BACT|nr:RagB/SusD family nutrient uptake outer membrane protein [Chitinophaga dinghuensis]RAJ75482.1 SusD-like starch-binding protein associating with outer membrane [Chitinophaga dinghuensis]